jgi:hypothetical protein
MELVAGCRDSVFQYIVTTIAFMREEKPFNK